MHVSCDPAPFQELFQAAVVSQVKDDFKDLRAQLRMLAKKADLLIIATDNDREGEAIGYEIIDECRAVKPRIEVRYKACLSLISLESILRAAMPTAA